MGIHLAVLFLLFDAVYGMNTTMSSEGTTTTELIPTIKWQRMPEISYRAHPKRLRTADVELPCPLGEEVTVICNNYSEDPCICANTINPVVPVKHEYYCEEEPFEFTHYIRLDIDAVVDRRYHASNASAMGLLSPIEIEQRVMMLFNASLPMERRENDLRTINKGMRFLRLTCDGDYYAILYIGLNATETTSSENENATIADLGFDINKIANRSWHHVDHIQSFKKANLPKVERPAWKPPTTTTEATIFEDKEIDLPWLHMSFGAFTVTVMIVTLVIAVIRRAKKEVKKESREQVNAFL
uniref:Uncharacterized protein n=1 Tax=Panagrellus redivivus TaxID=6233 RepID=A0A7E4UR56_PANRE